jgi:hypothetical protein
MCSLLVGQVKLCQAELLPGLGSLRENPFEVSSFSNWAIHLGRDAHIPSGSDCQETPRPLRDGSHMPVPFHDTDESVFRGSAG